jgi:hypothetical protein
MKKVLCFFIILTIITLQKTTAETIDCPSCGLPPELSGNIEITRGSVVFSRDSRITGAITLTNHGTLNGIIRVDESAGIQFVVRNDGAINATFNLSAGSALEQWILSESEITRLNVVGGTYIPVIRDEFSAAVNASDLLSVFETTIRIDKKELEINAKMSELDDLALRLDITDSIILRITDYDGRDLSLAARGFNGRVYYLIGGDDDPMFDYWVDSDRIYKVRETDYEVILGKNDKRAVFLNELRSRDPKNKILARLDGALSGAELSNVMGGTMFFNPLVLNEGMKRMISRAHFHNEAEIGFFVGARPVKYDRYHGSDVDFGRRNLFAAFHFGRATEDDDRKHGNADVYGIGLNADSGWFGIGAKTMLAKWKDIMILSGDNVKTVAESRLFYGFFDFSPAIGSFVPVLRANYIRSEIDGMSESNFYVSYGARAAVSEEKMGVRNTYGFYVMKNPDNIDFGIQADWHFVEDSASMSLSVGPGYLSAGVRFGF